MELEGEGLGPQCLFSDGTDLKQIMAKKEVDLYIYMYNTCIYCTLPYLLVLYYMYMVHAHVVHDI